MRGNFPLFFYLSFPYPLTHRLVLILHRRAFVAADLESAGGKDDIVLIFDLILKCF
jgi:hypothetical protein